MIALLAVKISAQTVTEASLLTSSLEDIQNETEFEPSTNDQVGISNDVTSLSAMSTSSANVAAARVSVQRVFEILDARAEVVESPNAIAMMPLRETIHAARRNSSSRAIA